MSASRREVWFVCYRLEPRGGMERAAVRLANALARERSVRLLVLRPQALRPWTVEHGVRVTVGARAVLALARLAVRKRDVPALVVVGLWSAAILALVPLPHRIVRIGWEHTLLPWRLREDRRVSRLLPLARATYRRSDAVVCVSRGVAQALTGILDDGSHIFVIPNLVDEPRNAIGRRTGSAPSDGSEVRLLAVGALRKVKNHGLALEALALLSPEYHLDIAGAGPERADLAREAQRLGIEHRVSFLGHVEDVDALFEKADVLVQPSLAETFSMSVLEAARSDVPVVVLDVPALDEVVPDLAVGFRSRESTPESFARAIREAASLRANAPSGLFEGCRHRRAIALEASNTVLRWGALLDGLLPTPHGAQG